MKKEKPTPIKYSIEQIAMDSIYEFARKIGNPTVHYDIDKIKMLEEFVEQAKTAAINITYHLHQTDRERYKWTDGKDKPEREVEK